ncbi:MAG: ISNCY family transposase [Candidatus Entotheonellia bacterium]
MTAALAFEDLVQAFHHQLASLPDSRKGKKTQYAITDAALGAFAVFCTQAPSFLASQRTMQQAKGRSNAASLFGIQDIPCDNQIRTLLDPVAPAQLFPVFEGVYAALERAGHVSAFRFFAGQLLIALDGLEYFSSQEIHCAQCSQRTHANGRVTYVHQAITPVIVAPGKPQVIPLEPEFITPQDGHAKQDCEQVAAKRWIERQAGRYQQVTILGDDLYCKQPFCELLLDTGFNFILVCKPDSHKTLYEWIATLEAAGDLQQFRIRHWNGRFREVHTYRYATSVPLREGEDALEVNWCELTITKETNGTILYRNAFATMHHLDRSSVESVVQAGRARWKIENENNNVLKTKGYHLEHNYGHGKQYLSAVLLTLNLLAFLFHTVLGWVDQKYHLVRQVLAARQTFFQDLQALTRYLLFESWDHLLDFMLQGLEIAVPPDAS